LLFSIDHDTLKLVATINMKLYPHKYCIS